MLPSCDLGVSFLSAVAQVNVLIGKVFENSEVVMAKYVSNVFTKHLQVSCVEAVLLIVCRHNVRVEECKSSHALKSFHTSEGELLCQVLVERYRAVLQPQKCMLLLAFEHGEFASLQSFRKDMVLQCFKPISPAFSFAFSCL